MGEYFIAVILSESGEILAWISPHDYGSSMDYVCHFFVGDPFMDAVDAYLYYNRTTNMKVVWVSDYAPKEAGSTKSLYDRCMDLQSKRYNVKTPPPEKRWLTNHTKKMCIELVCDSIHPLPDATLVGEYSESYEHPNSWLKDFITVEDHQFY